MNELFHQRLDKLIRAQKALQNENNVPFDYSNGIIQRYQNPILTATHTPLLWRYDFNPKTNPFLMERFGINSVFNAGAIKWKNKYIILARVEGKDRKSFFAVAESPNGIDHFKFWEYPLNIPDIDSKETNIYDMRLTQHEDGWIYGIFCSERQNEDTST
ncbi:MAG TPA: glycosidase, partial [Chitinophagaceae bacterium]|nr:glycosidase [Chitinophagaceae bacterium]